jgi:hypothetical protein
VDEHPTQPTTPLAPSPGWRWMLFAIFRAALVVPGRVDEQSPQPTTPLTLPSGRHWKIYAICGPVLIVSGIVLRFLGDAGTGTFLVVIGTTMLAGHLYMRPRALYVHDVCREVGYCNF